MTNYKLIYFDSRGRAEYIRLIFAAAGVEYEDIRIPDKEEWAKVKEDMPFGQVPVLEIDGKFKLGQSYTICRYLAKEFGLHGKSPLDELRIDMIVDCQEDFNGPLVQQAREPDQEKKKALQKVFVDKTQPYLMQKFENILKENKGGDGWFVGDDMTWADLAFLHGLSWPAVFGMETPWDEFPKLKALKERIENQPKIAKWLAERKVTPW